MTLKHLGDAERFRNMGVQYFSFKIIKAEAKLNGLVQ